MPMPLPRAIGIPEGPPLSRRHLFNLAGLLAAPPIAFPAAGAAAPQPVTRSSPLLVFGGL
ncbi:hypothetical protein [Falsiroseomonas stagni]|uniref:Tat (Twin-arginine translocation) pathway signal sequence n=1 Tax=Falsiroseomonas stagni DSM 19981 TaxID=1123062 RepID=A0A1I4F5V8_9PROT|nr:hypothetical protein [Falsiroseomonas stagni]SFL13294.1 hypothetical protein SAMN02745775_12341 [Falsiroseomonas stagni DSM 19981]